MAGVATTVLMHCHFCGEQRPMAVRIVGLTPPSPEQPSGGATLDVTELEAHFLTVWARSHRGPVHLVGAHG